MTGLSSLLSSKMRSLHGKIYHLSKGYSFGGRNNNIKGFPSFVIGLKHLTELLSQFFKRGDFLVLSSFVRRTQVTLTSQTCSFP